MAEYLATCVFQPISTSAVEDEHIAILPPAGVSIFLKRFRIGTGSTQGDQPIRIRIRRTSAAGTGGTTSSPTPIKIRTDSPASVCTLTQKSAGGTRTPGANVDLLLDVTMIHRSFFEWIPRDWRDTIESGVNQRLVVTLQIASANVSNNFMELFWVE